MLWGGAGAILGHLLFATGSVSVADRGELG